MDAGTAIDDRSKLNNDFDFLDRLRQLGAAAAEQFLERHFDDIGRRSTLDLQGEPAPPGLDDAGIPAKTAAC
jgi:NTE family protein